MDIAPVLASRDRSDLEGGNIATRAGKFLTSDDLTPLPRSLARTLTRLGTRAGRERSGSYMLEGPSAIEDALARGVVFEAIVGTGRGLEVVGRWAAEGRIAPRTRLHQTDDRAFAGIADTTTPQGIVAVGRLPARELADLPDRPGSLVLLADGLQDPGNLGTLLRTLAAVGGRAAVCTRGTVDAFNPKALRGAAGATFALAVADRVEPVEAAGWCVDRGLSIVALAADGPSLFEIEPPPAPIALAVGNEGGGLSEVVRARARVVAGLPMTTAVESLSAAVAGSVALYVLAHRLVAAERR